ncbi:MAG: hypothetical protein KAH09_10715, partial [Desulfobacula sp.]|nr:hypothetical protein [Desulfobacula sp.]
MKYLGTLSLLLLLLITSCREDIEDVITVIDTPGPTVIDGYEPTQKIINGSVVGFVVDENQEPMAYTKVFFEDITLTTDHFGHFFLDDINMNALGS